MTFPNWHWTTKYRILRFKTLIQHKKTNYCIFSLVSHIHNKEHTKNEQDCLLFFLSMNLLIGSMRSSSVFILSDGRTTASPSSRSSSSVLNHISSSSSSVRASRRKRWFLRMERMLVRKTHQSKDKMHIFLCLICHILMLSSLHLLSTFTSKVTDWARPVADSNTRDTHMGLKH